MQDTINIDDIDASDRLRPVKPDHVELIAASIEERGLEQPIVVRPAGAGFKLTIGAHRLAALRALGWTKLVVGEHVLIRAEDEIEAKIAEVDENLARHELNALDRALFIAERKRLYEERRRVHGKGGDRKSNKFKEEIKSQSLAINFAPRFTLDAAKRIGLGEETIKLALRIAQKIDAEAAAAIRGTMIERNQQELLALIELAPDEQREAAKAIAEGKAKTVREAKVAAGLEEAVADDPQARVWAAFLPLLPKADIDTLKAMQGELKKELKRKGSGDK